MQSTEKYKSFQKLSLFRPNLDANYKILDTVNFYLIVDFAAAEGIGTFTQMKLSKHPMIHGI